MRKAGAMVKAGRRGLRGMSWLVVAWLLGSCGGGTEQIEPFVPRQIIYIGDETVGLMPDGSRYGINGVDANGAIDCAQLPIWSQQMASDFGIASDRCSATAAASVTRAAFGAKAGDIEAQVSAQIAAGVTSKDLFVVMVGMNDIFDLYENYGGDRNCVSGTRDPPQDTLMGQLAARGSFAAAQVSRILAAGGRAIVSTVHDLGYTPYARAREAAMPGHAALISCMTSIYNARVRVDIKPFDGRLWGLVLADDNTLALVREPASYGLGNITDGACAVAPPACTLSTLVTGATAMNYLWADDRHFAPLLHNQLAAQAVGRARGNPF